MRTNRSEYNAHAALRQGAAVPARKPVAPRRGLNVVTLAKIVGAVIVAVILWGAL